MHRLDSCEEALSHLSHLLLFSAQIIVATPLRYTHVLCFSPALSHNEALVTHSK